MPLCQTSPMPSDHVSDPPAGRTHPVGTLARVGAAAIAVGVCACVAVAIAYPALPAMLPVSRWQLEPKSPVIALRLPLINLAMIGFALVAWRALARSEPHVARRLGPLLMATAVAKAVIEAVELLAQPTPSPLLFPTLLACLGLGLSACIVTGRALAPGRWRSITVTSGEKKTALGLTASIVLLEVPLVA